MKNFLITALISITLMSCTAKRQEVFTQGQGTDLDTIASWNERLVPITTGETIGSASTTRAQDNVKVNDATMNHFDLVKFKVEDPRLQTLIGTPPFHGKENVAGVYSLKVKLTDNYLKFYKVAAPKDLPFEEHAYKEETLEDGRIAIPMLGYKINGYYHIEPVKTGDDQNSHHLTEIADTDHSKSTHVKIDWSSREYFQPVKTTDLMPAEIFFKKNIVSKDGKDTVEYKPYEWYYAETVIEKSLTDSNTIVGENSTRTENSQLIPASKIMFIPRENELRIVNVARDERMSRDQIASSADLNSEAALIIPVKWSEYRTKADGKNLSLQGETVEERKWNQRGNFEMNIPELKSAGITEGTTRLLDLQVDTNYFGFTVLNMIGNQGRKIHYSFLRADQGRTPYTPRPSFKNDRNLFGFFTSVKPFIANWEFYTEENFDKRIYMSRMNPNSKEIVFHMSTGSPKGLNDIAERSIKAWENTFSEAMKGSGKELKISFDPNPVQLGDLRYNVIHLVDTLSEDGLLGFGPSVADPETGEIISATTNVYVNSTQSIAASTVRQYIIDRLEKRLTKDVTGEAILSSADSFDVGSASPETKALIASRKTRLTKKEAEVAAIDIGKTSVADLMKQYRKNNKKTCDFAAQAVLSSNDRDIQKYCPEVEKLVESYLNASIDVSSRSKAKGNWEKVWSESKDAIHTCSTKLMRGKLLSTLIHEIGHNFGLRHNFYASYDKANFKKATTIFGEEIVAHSSSIMEYTDWDEDRLTETGTYDVAAIRFGYGEQVELKDGSIVKADAQKSLDASALKPYLFCSDEEASTNLNARCKRHDAGTTPMELVKFYIKGYERSEAIRKLRRARPMSSDPESLAGANIERTFLPLKDIYDEWRYVLGEYVRKSNRYLSDYGQKEYAALLENMKKDPLYGPQYEQYHDAAEEIYAFFKKVAFGPNEYCLVDVAGDQRVMELEKLRDLIAEQSRGSTMIRSCADALKADGDVSAETVTKDFMKVLGVSTIPKVIGQVGYPMNSYRFEKAETLGDYLGEDGKYTRERYDVVGNELTRYFAGLMIHKRMANYRNILSQFAPNMMDEPTHYVDYLVDLNSRLVDGVDLTKFDIKKPQPLFSQEGGLMGDLANQLMSGLYTPGETLGSLNRVATSKKISPLFIYVPEASEDPESFAATLKLNGRIAYAAQSEDDYYAYSLISKYNEISDLVALTPSAIYSKLLAATPKAEELPQLTIEKFSNIVGVIGKAQKTFPDYAKCFTAGSPTLVQLGKIIPMMIEDFQAVSEKGDEEVKKFLALNYVEYSKSKLKDEEVLFTQENLKELAGVMGACLKDPVAGKGPTEVKRNSKDFEAQKSMILEVLGNYAN